MHGTVSIFLVSFLLDSESRRPLFMYFILIRVFSMQGRASIVYEYIEDEQGENDLGGGVAHRRGHRPLWALPQVLTWANTWGPAPQVPGNKTPAHENS